jgi:hypothetical protein
MANKMFYSHIQLMGGSVVRDESGEQVSLTSAQRLSIVNAVGGAATGTNPVATQGYVDQSISSLQAGVKWRNPVNTVASNAPADPSVGDRYINTTDNKLYTCVVEGNWGVGATPEENWTVVAQDTDGTWTYDADGDEWIRTDVNSLPYATTTTAGKVTFATDGEVASAKAVQADDSRLIKGYYSVTLNGTGDLTVTHNLDTEKIMVQAWKADELSEIGIARSSTDPANALDITVRGAGGDVEIFIIALP